MQTLNEARETAQRQLDAESKKKSNKVCLAMIQRHDIVHFGCLTCYSVYSESQMLL
jgi:hypothetical protein